MWRFVARTWGGAANLPEEVTRSYDLVVGTFDVFWDLFQVLFSGFISGLERWGVQVRVGFLSMF